MPRQDSRAAACGGCGRRTRSHRTEKVGIGGYFYAGDAPGLGPLGLSEYTSAADPHRQQGHRPFIGIVQVGDRQRRSPRANATSRSSRRRFGRAVPVYREGRSVHWHGITICLSAAPFYQRTLMSFRTPERNLDRLRPNIPKFNDRQFPLANFYIRYERLRAMKPLSNLRLS